MTMQVLHGLDGLKALPAGSIMTIGNFDGVHRGHQLILRDVRERAKDGAIAAVLTFYPHPTRVLRPDKAPPLLMTLDQRLAAFRREGIGAAFVLRFDGALAALSAEDFVARYLVETMQVEAVFVGDNFRFGHKQGGDVKLLTELGERWGFRVMTVPPVIDSGVVISSTAIRQEILRGAVDEARRLLGYPFTLEGEIRPGTGLGRKLVVPTLNLATSDQILPAKGVYATEARVDGKTYKAATNVGVRPTFDGAGITVESHLIDFSASLSEGPMQVRFWERIRGEQKFASPQELREQVLRDVDRAKAYFADEKFTGR
jgi:riboflavin kinase / FMN adenylyltransferase